MSKDETAYQEEFARQLRQILLNLHWPQSKLARKLDVSRQFVGTFCNGKSLPNCRTFENIIHIFSSGNVKEEIRSDLFRIYISALFPGQTSRHILQNMLYPADQHNTGSNDLLSKALVNMLHSLTAGNTVENFYSSLLESADADCCSIFKNSNGRCELTSFYHNGRHIPVKTELESIGAKYFHSWLHILNSGTVLEIDVPGEEYSAQWGAAARKLKSFAYLTGLHLPGGRKEALAVMYLHRKPMNHTHNRAVINCAAKFLKLHAARQAE